MNEEPRKLDPNHPLMQNDIVKWFLGLCASQTEWISVCVTSDGISDCLPHRKSLDYPTRFHMYSALLRSESVQQSLQQPSWDIDMGCDSHEIIDVTDDVNSARSERYVRCVQGIERLVQCQYHFEILPPMLPVLSEDFRLYHNLWVNAKGSEAWFFDWDGTEELAAKVAPQDVQILRKLLFQYLAGRQRYLALYIDSVQYFEPLSDISDDRLNLIKIEESDTANIMLSIEPHEGGSSYSRLLGKILIKPPDISRSGKFPYDSTKTDYPKFIVGRDEHGEDIRFTCCPDKLGDVEPKQFHYLHRVYFRREVLDKYYRESKYKIRPRRLECGSLWVAIDKDHSDYVVLYLGDIGRYIPEYERYHWLNHNISVRDEGGSESALRHDFFNQSVNVAALDEEFKRRYHSLIETWSGRFGWSILLPLHQDDTHLLDKMRLLSYRNSQSELDDRVLDLNKLIVESINEKRLRAHLLRQGHDLENIKNLRGIQKLEEFLCGNDCPEPIREQTIEFLKKLQKLRSSGSAHRKGSSYRKIKESFGTNLTSRQIFERLLGDASRCMLELTRWLRSSM